MAGASITLDIDRTEISDAIARLTTFDRDALPSALTDIGEYVLRATRDRADLEVDPDGNPWVALSPRYETAKKKKRPVATKLKYDFHMLGDQLSAQVIGDELFVGTNAVYGAVHQFGGEHIPARPFLGISAQDEVEVLDILGDHYEAALKGRGGSSA